MAQIIARCLNPIRSWFHFLQPRNIDATIRTTAHKHIQFIDKPESFSAPETFLFLNESARLSEIGWRGDQKDPLWRYNQHYFDCLMAPSALANGQKLSDLVEKWIMDNPPFSSIAWDPYTSSLRIVNWIKALLKGQPMPEGSIDSLLLQVAHLDRTIEWHIMGNHLFANGKALFLAGCFFEGERAQRWFRRGKKILIAELDEQILDDGGHFELSPMYHAIILEDCLDLMNIIRTYDLASSNDLTICLRKRHRIC